MKNVLVGFILTLMFSVNVYATDINCATGNNQSIFDDAGLNCFTNGTPADAEKVNANFKALLDLVTPAGLVSPFAGPSSSVPAGWLYCDGSAVSRTTYDKLFAVIGTSHGVGDGSTTFNLPDYRGRFLRGVDDSAGRDPDKASRTAASSGGNTGNQVGSIQEDEFKSHKHNYRGYPGGSAHSWSYAGFGHSGGGTSQYASPGTANTGGSETRPKNANVNWIIKY